MKQSVITTILLEYESGGLDCLVSAIERWRQEGSQEISLLRSNSLEEILKELPESARKVAIIELPQGNASGLCLIETFKERAPDVPVIALGHSLEISAIRAALQSGAVDYIIKSKADSELVKSIYCSVEREFREQRRIQKEKAQLLSRIEAHLKEPLQYVVKELKVLSKSDLELSTNQKFTQLLRNSERLGELLSVAKALSGINSGNHIVKLKECSLSLLLTRVEQEIKNRCRGLNISFRSQRTYPIPLKVISESAKLKMLLVSLAQDACELEEVKRIVFTTKFEQKEETISFEIKVFWTKDDRAKNHKPGGLAAELAEQLVPKLNGSFEINDRSKQSTSFKISLQTGPINESELIQGDNKKQEKDSFTRRTIRNKQQKELHGHVLLAEDCPSIQALLSYLLEKVGISVTIVDNGKDAISEAVSNEFDMVLLDMQMPIMDGFTAARLLRNQGYKKPIIAITANSRHETLTKCIDDGCDSYITKPFRKQALYSTLEHYLNGEPSDKQNPFEPIYSNIVEEEPELAHAVLRFLDYLPQRLTNIEQALDTKNWDELKNLVHQLKAAATFGYDVLGALACQVEIAAAQESVNNTTKLIEELREHCTRVLAGKNHVNEQLHSL